MHIIFGQVNIWTVILLKILKFFKFQVFYLHINAKTNIKKNEIAIKLKKNNIYPLPIELQKKISSESNYAMADFQEFTYRKNIKIIPDAIIGRYCKLFSIDKEKKIKLRLLIQDFVGHKQSIVVSALATWAALYKFKKIIYVSFKFTGFYISDTRQNVYNIIIPVDLLNHLSKSIKKIFLVFFSFRKEIYKSHEKKILKDQELKKFEKNYVAFVAHKGLIYGSKDHIIFEKSLYYSDNKNSCLNKHNILHLDYENYSSPEQNLHWVCLKKIKLSRAKIFFKTLLASIKTCYLIQSWSKFLGWLLCIQQYNRYIKYCEVLKKFKSLKLALIDYEDLCPKTLILALDKNNIRTVATQERFITPFKHLFFIVMLDTYFAASEYVANRIKNSKFHDIKNIIPVGQYRCDYISLYKKEIIPKEISKAKENGKKILIMLGHHTTKHWFESYSEPIINWKAQVSFLEDVIKLSQDLNDTFIILRYKTLDWINAAYFKKILKKINDCENINISNNYESFYSYRLCAHADLVIAKHTSLGDECLSREIPVLFYDYTHNMQAIISNIFDYSSSNILCHNYEDLLRKSKSFLLDQNSHLIEEINVLNDKFYKAENNGTVKDTILQYLEKDIKYNLLSK